MAAKSGLEGFMKVMAEELEDSGIRVNCVDPGPTATDLRKSIFPGEEAISVKDAGELIPLYRELMNPESSIRHGEIVRYEQGWDYGL